MCLWCYSYKRNTVSVEDAGEIPFTRVEYFCQSCYDKTQEREKEKPSNRSKESLAEFYGVVIGEPNVR